MRQALQYQRLAGPRARAARGGPVAVGATASMHEGEVSALLGVAGIPSVSESTMVARDCALAALRGGPHPRPARVRARDGRGDRAGQGGGHAGDLRGHAAPPAAHRRGTCARSTRNMKMNPPLRAEDDRQALIEALRSGAIDCVATDHAPHAREEKEQPFELAPMGVTGLETAFAALHTGPRAAGRARARPAGRAHDRGRRAVRPARADARARARRPTSAWSTSTPSGRWARPATRAARPTAPSPAGG